MSPAVNLHFWHSYLDARSHHWKYSTTRTTVETLEGKILYIWITSWQNVVISSRTGCNSHHFRFLLIVILSYMSYGYHRTLRLGKKMSHLLTTSLLSANSLYWLQLCYLTYLVLYILGLSNPAEQLLPFENVHLPPFWGVSQSPTLQKISASP